MKIAYLTCVYPPYPGGIGIAAQGMAQEMARRGHEVHVFTPKVSGFRCQVLGGKIHELRPWLRWGNAAFLPQLLWRLRDFDIIHLLYPFYGVAEFLPLIKKISRAKIIVHHMMDAYSDGWLGHIFSWHASALMPRIFRCADTVLTLSEDFFLASSLTSVYQNFENAPPIEFVPNGVDTDLFQPRLKKEAPITNDQLPIILFAGGLDRAHYFKGVPVLLAALRMLQWGGVPFKCLIVGDGNLRKEYEEQAREEGILHKTQSPTLSGHHITLAPGSVEFVGLVPHEKVSEYFCRANICVVPSTELIENFSITAAEAQACGVPAVVSDLPGVRVTIKDHETGYLVRPGDPEDLATKIFYVLEDKERAKKMGEAGRARVEKMYSLKVIGGKLEDIYKQLLRVA